MDENHSSGHELLQRQVALLYELASSLERAQAAVLNSDFGQIGAQTILQQRLCGELQQLAGKLSLQSSPPEQTGSAGHGAEAATWHPVAERQHSLLAELRDIGKQVEGLNRDYSALLRRARRTVDIFCRVLTNSGITYLPPAAQARSVLQGSRG
jgi:hypothetical protein